ncbi:molecular chaperone DjiA [Hwanghaeella grinnelliae]|uniref:Molecular chaperone DjiA n=1 Tax=Hwanghaeella grinnelliae TaxID=2500179 RepID=A0A3S2VMH5_9PROT|nr:TerB family tellurite resistance protein [Hwanghaeella grinnelliae]RVU33828.1 molecular chaperone DjiA [Hwanghaeella grinnelliae]
MSIWGKILGGAAGFAIGGPLGALIGAVGGHFVDRLKSDSEGGRENQKSVTFTIAVIVLGAKMAKADGHVTPDEVSAFKEVFRVPPDEMKNVSRIFNQARRDSAGYEMYARQVAGMFKDDPAVLEELLWCLAYIAKADGHIHPGELQFLRGVSDIFGFDQATVERVTAIAMSDSETDDPYVIMGVPRSASDDEIKAAHRKLVIEHHPDKLIAQGLPEEFVEIANQKLAAINAAFDKIKRERGLT